MSIGQKHQLLLALHQTDAQHTSGADGDFGLTRLIPGVFPGAGILNVGTHQAPAIESFDDAIFRVHIRNDATQPVTLRADRNHHKREAEQHHAQHVPAFQSSDPEHDDRSDHGHERRPEVRNDY